ncbi:dihydroxyacetone kinase subunit DhaL [Anaerosalibacter massiliensis]|uniref:phosphoenolpyruvate--glycerone phosphotransferase n=1 Tax=Anaerosalibacter massiliensis TaxID=1347392 RepID=A0A9X2MHN3_9FIRM|nr:dihydroxyacetone kinase subunit DhaL [Anaerosalibacter massiliensis]MCR2044223.1 dihydroxyacetone kinase subunit DhaL [Anaerosalibacter massiliensis]
MITSDILLRIIENMVNTIKENKDYLTELDAKIGDSDHGINMDKGFSAVLEKLPSLKEKDCGTILKTVAMVLISKVGGASGPLYGTVFLKGAAVVQDKMEINEEDAVAIFDEAIKGVKMRGKAEKGDKTMLDALIPAYEDFKDSIENGEDIVKASYNAQKAAYEGVEYTKEIIAKKGRASYLGERSIGHQDPGATSSYLLLKTIWKTLDEI